MSLTLQCAGGDVSPINPATVAAVIDYWDADTLGAGGTAVSSWVGSKSAKALTQATGANQPLVAASAINGHKAITFDAVNDWLSYAPGAFITTANLEVFVVASRTGGTGTQVCVGVDSGTNDYGNDASATPVVYFDSTQQLGGFRNSQNAGLLSWPLARSTFGVIHSFWAGTAHTVKEGGTAAAANFAWGSFNASRLTVGAGVDAGSPSYGFWGGQVAALVVANGLTAAERAGIQAFLTARFLV